MKKLAVFYVLMTVSVTAWAACTIHTVDVNGKTLQCQTCCNNGNCYTSCF